MTNFVKETLTINGIRTVVHTAGTGDPVVLFHGAGTVDGFDFTSPWADHFRVIAPYHPGFGLSEDDPSITEHHDYVMHYLELFDALGLERFSLVGLSFGGDLAARFAVEHSHRLRKLVLIAPSTMVDPQHPPLDIVAVPGDELVPMLVSNFDHLKTRLPAEPDLDFVGDRYREATAFARIHWERPRDRKFTRYLHRIRTPTMILWGDEDRLVPVEQAETWRAHLPDVEIRIVSGAGHLVHLESPESVELIERFLSQQVAPG